MGENSVCNLHMFFSFLRKFSLVLWDVSSFFLFSNSPSLNISDIGQFCSKFFIWIHRHMNSSNSKIRIWPSEFWYLLATTVLGLKCLYFSARFQLDSILWSEGRSSFKSEFSKFMWRISASFDWRLAPTLLLLRRVQMWRFHGEL